MANQKKYGVGITPRILKINQHLKKANTSLKLVLEHYEKLTPKELTKLKDIMGLSYDPKYLKAMVNDLMAGGKAIGIWCELR